jgi:hypothetical protein
MRLLLHKMPITQGIQIALKRSQAGRHGAQQRAVPALWMNARLAG